jgi:hypothetical protein
MGNPWIFMGIQWDFDWEFMGLGKKPGNSWEFSHEI